MLLDIEQRDKEIIVSYYNKEGEVAFKRYPIAQFKNWHVCDAKERDTSEKFKNWDGRSVKMSPSRQFNKFSLVYFMDGLPEADKAEIYEYNMPKTYFVDIETEIVDGFPKAEEAKSRILAFSIVTPSKKVIVLGLEDMEADKIKKIEDDTNEYFKQFNDEWSFQYIKFKTEYDMVYTFVNKFMTRFPMMTGWNFINYDWQYIVNRCKRLQIDITEAAKTGSLDSEDSRPLHMGILDYMQLYDKYDRSVKVKESNALDFVAGQVLKTNKIKYTGSLQDLYRDNFTKYIYYNVVDSILVYYIDKKLKSNSNTIKWYGFDDGHYAAVRIAEILTNSDKNISELINQFPQSFSTPELNITVTDETKFSVIEDFEKNCNLDGEKITIDGLRVNFKNGWGLIRASNTTPKLVLRFENFFIGAFLAGVFFSHRGCFISNGCSGIYLPIDLSLIHI